MNKLFSIGDKIYGFCNGYFDRDDYDTKLCIMVSDRYAVFQYLDGEFEGNATVLNNPDRLDEETVAEWKQDYYAL